MSVKQQNRHNSDAPSLLRALLLDIFVYHWFVTVLAIGVIFSAMLLVKNTHESRRLMSQWKAMQATYHDDQILWESLRLELTSLSEADRISSLAKKQLGMVEVNNSNEKVISL